MLKKVALPKNINFLKESEFDFVDDRINNPLDGVEFTMNRSPIEGDEKNIYYIIDDGSLFVKIKWYGGGQLKRTFKRDRVMDLFKRGVWKPYFESTDNIKESEFDFIRDHDSLDGVTFKIPPDSNETIYKIKDDSLDHRVIVTWDNSELIDNRDSNYSEINQKLKFNLTNSDVKRLFQFYFDSDEWDSHLSEKRERLQDYMINNFEDNELLYYMGQRESLENTYNRDVVKRYLNNGSWVIYDEKINESKNEDFGWVEDTNPKEIENLYSYVIAYFDWSKKYKEYSYSTNMIGEVEWYSSINDKYYYYATPYWEGNGVMKIDAVDEVGNDIEVHTIPLPKFKYEEQLEEWLRLEYPKIVYKEIKIFENTQQYSGDTLNESVEFGWFGDYKDVFDKNKNYALWVGEIDTNGLTTPQIKSEMGSPLPNQTGIILNLLYSLGDMGYDTTDAIRILTKSMVQRLSWLYINGKQSKTITADPMTVEYDSMSPRDPSYGGQYEIVDNFKDFYFLVTNKVIKESNDLQWIKDVGANRIDLVKKIKEGLANYGVEVEWERTHLGYNQEDTDGTRGEVFAKFFYDTGDREFFIELIESENGLYGFYVYEYSEKYDTYYVNANYNSLGTPRESDEIWRHVCWTVLNQMDAFPKKDEVRDLGDYLSESEDFDWVKNVTPRMNATLLKPGQKFYDKWGDVIRVLEYLGRDGEGEVCYEPPCSLLRFRKIKDPSGYRMIPGLPADDPQNTDMIMIPSDFDSYIESGKLKLVSKRTMYESKDFDWVDDSNDFKLDKNKNYVLDVSDLDLSNVEVHPRSRFTKREVLLDEILKNLSEMGYDTNVVREEVLRGVHIHYLYLTKCRYSGNLKVEYDGEFVEDITYGGRYEVVDNVKDFIFMIKNKIVKESKDFDWVSKFEPRMSFKDVLMGEKYSIKFNNYNLVLDHLDKCGIQNVKHKLKHTEYVIPKSFGFLQASAIYCGNNYKTKFDGTLPSLELSFYDKNNVELISYFWFAEEDIIHLKTYNSRPTPILEDFENLDWVRDIKPKGFEKSKSYVVDVSDLKPYTPMYNSPTSEEYTKLTRADVLDKFKGLGYNVDDISITDADYLYIEPNDKAGYWDDVVWVDQTHWLDYDMKHNTPDPTYNGKYEVMDVNDLMFLLDNKFISESKTITEVAGISFESREWAKIINDEILENPNEKERLIIDGYDYPEASKGFPIDYIVIDFYDKLTGYGQEHSGYDKDGNYVVLLYIQPKVIGGTGGFNLRTVLNHEMKHAWDDYNRLSKGQPSIDKNKENRELYNKDFILMLSDKNVRGPIKEILKYYYYLSELEKTAYLENVYDGNLNYEKIIRDISSKDFEPFKERFDLDINWHLMNTAYDIPFLKKFKSPVEFIDYSSEELRSKAISMIKKINKMKYIHNK